MRQSGGSLSTGYPRCTGTSRDKPHDRVLLDLGGGAEIDIRTRDFGISGSTADQIIVLCRLTKNLFQVFGQEIAGLDQGFSRLSDLLEVNLS
jgi:hypothetical protein